MAAIVVCVQNRPLVAKPGSQRKRAIYALSPRNGDNVHRQERKRSWLEGNVMRKPNFLLETSLAAVMLVLAAACTSGPQKSGQVVTRPGPSVAPARTTVLNTVVPSPAAGATVSSGPQRISARAAKEKIGRGIDVTIIDLRSKAEFDQLHISGAIHMPSEELQQRYVELRKESQIIIY